MPEFICFTHVHRGGKSVPFAPGDEVPEWALALIADHVHDGPKGELDALAIGGEDVGDETDAKGKPEYELNGSAGETEGADGDVSDDNGKVEESGEPDFTKPATPKRSRPSKTQA